MALQKQSIDIPLGIGLDTKTDPDQVAAGKLLAVSNCIFDTNGELKKRNGFANLTSLSGYTNLRTLNGNLLATGSVLSAFNESSNSWITQGTIRPVSLSVRPMVRTSTAQTAVDSATASNGMTLLAFSESGSPFYQIVDTATGQVLVAKTALPANSVNPRTFVLGRYFILLYGCSTGGARMQYIAIPLTNITSPGSATDISTNISSSSAGFDAYVANNMLYIAFNGSDVGGAVRVHTLSNTLVISSAKILATYSGTLFSVTADTSTSTPVIYVSWWGSNDGYTVVLNQSLVTIAGPAHSITSTTITEMSSVANNGTCSLIYQTTNTYAYNSVRSDYVSTVSISQAGSVGSATTIARSVGLASKAFTISGTSYVLVAYNGALQPTYFLINLSGVVLAKLAYGNGGGYASTQVLPSVSINGTEASIAYLFKTQIVAVNKTQGVSGAVSGIWAQLGVNLVTFQLGSVSQYTAEIANTLHLSGGLLWMYDAVAPVEHGFFVYPEDIGVTTATGAGALTAQQYYYTFCYEWTDGQGNLHRSAPSIPVGQVTTTSSSTNTLKVPTLRLTAKTGNNKVRIVGYRWSAAQQNYYQFTSISSPTINDTTTDFVTITDTLADSSILGNTLLYTTGGEVENTSAPSFKHTAIGHAGRLMGISAEDPNTIWFSKQVLSATPVEMSNLLTYYVAPTTGAQGSTGDCQAIVCMDDKNIVFKESSIYYFTGTGPDNTGANNDFSEPVFITATAGCSNPNSIVLTPNGLMFQSSKGIWLLGRDLSTQYIGDAVEAYNSDTVVSALNIPGTNQIRFTLDSGIMLVYDYYRGQWGTFTNIPAISATLYEDMHTYLNAQGLIRQESPGVYLDGSSPVLMSFTSAWLKLTNLQGFQRVYFFHLLSNYVTPHKLNIQLAYDYNSSPSQSIVISPTNYSPAYGGDQLYGSGSPYGGPGNVEQWRIFPAKQKCQAIQITVTEVFDSSFNTAAGAGLKFSGLNAVLGHKAGYPKLTAAQSAG